ncbi:MAG: hypothetical protein II968_01030 [Selenomonadaceae bacterium]|nr:hypothetical protein [Selenomonadaceae bacterium]
MIDTAAAKYRKAKRRGNLAPFENAFCPLVHFIADGLRIVAYHRYHEVNRLRTGVARADEVTGSRMQRLMLPLHCPAVEILSHDRLLAI